MNDFFNDIIKNSLSHFNNREKALFCLYNTERIIDLYQLFQDTFGIGDFKQVREMCDYLWLNCIKNNKNAIIENYFSNIQKTIPDSEKYPGITNNIVLNIFICLDISYKCLFNNNGDAHITGLYIYDTLFNTILSTRKDIKYITQDIIDEIDKMNLILEEKEREMSIIQLIDQNELTGTFINRIRDMAIKDKYIFNLK